MSNIDQALSDLHHRYTYKRDKGRDQWQILSKSGRAQGDCEDFALTLLRDHFGMSGMWWALLRGHCELVYCTINANDDGHAVAVIDGLIYDCNLNKSFAWFAEHAKRNNYKRVYKYSLTSIIIKLVGRWWFVAGCTLSTSFFAISAQLLFNIID